jgi:hypothetical protein
MKKLPSGTTPTDKKSLTKPTVLLNAKDICYIIKACSEAGVSELKFGDLEVSFKGGALLAKPGKDTPATLGFKENEAYQNEQQPALPDRKAPSEKKMSLFDKEILEELEKSQLMIEDPIGYERFVIDEQLSRDAGTDANSEEEY